MSSNDIPPLLLRRLKFSAHRHHRSLEAEMAACLSAGVDLLAQREERFRQKAPRLRQKATGFLDLQRLHAMINEGRA